MIGQNTRLYQDTTLLASVLEISEITLSRDTTENTKFGNAHQFKEFEAGLIDPGELSLTLEYDKGDSSHLALKTSFDSGEKKPYTFRMPDDLAFGFDAIVTSWGVEVPMSETCKRKVAIKISGPVTEADYV